MVGGDNRVRFTGTSGGDLVKYDVAIGCDGDAAAVGGGGGAK